MPATNTAEQDYDVIFNNAYAPAFFNKLAADYGVVPQTEEQAVSLLRQAGKLRTAHDGQVVKQASATLDPITAAEQRLDQTLNKLAGHDPWHQDSQIDAFTAQLASDPNIASAVIGYQNAVAKTALAK
jgi:hypothetical protein